jgi:uncharacterized membrane protein
MLSGRINQGRIVMAVAKFEDNAHNIASFADIHSRFSPTRNVNVELARSLTPSERLAVWVTDRVGSMGFFFLIGAWTILWLGWNTLGPAELRFDPGPSFLTWLFISNLLQLHLMPLIMVGQNLQDRYGELVASADFNISQRTEAEVEAILQHLVNQNALTLEILRRVERLENAGGAGR